MEITIERYSRKMTYADAATLDEFWELAKRVELSLDRKQQRHWDRRECDPAFDRSGEICYNKNTKGNTADRRSALRISY